MNLQTREYRRATKKARKLFSEGKSHREICEELHMPMFLIVRMLKDDEEKPSK